MHAALTIALLALAQADVQPPDPNAQSAQQPAPPEDEGSAAAPTPEQLQALEQRIAELETQLLDERERSIAAQEDTARGLEGVESRLEAARQRQLLADQGRAQYLERINQSLASVDIADELLEEGSYDASRHIADADAVLASASGDALDFGGEQAASLVADARRQLIWAQVQLGQRNFLEARVSLRFAGEFLRGASM